MSQKIGVVDYGYAGNVFNIRKTIENTDKTVSTMIIKTQQDVKKADKIVLPGVGSYKDVMEKITDLSAMLEEQIQNKPTLGICLGMQILSEKGYEFGETKGFSVIEVEVRKMPVKGRVPHIGWARIEPIKNSRILAGVTSDDSFYFMHSYELINYKDVIALSDYCEHKFVCAIERDNVFGVQFHPEKSRDSGFRVFKNFINV